MALEKEGKQIRIHLYLASAASTQAGYIDFYSCTSTILATIPFFSSHFRQSIPQHTLLVRFYNFILVVYHSNVKPWLPKREQPSLLLTRAQLVDPVEGKVHPSASVHIGHGVIQTVSIDGSKPITVPEDTMTVDLEGRYLCPGLMDAHVHISAVPREMDFRHVMAMPESECLLRMPHVCRDIALPRNAASPCAMDRTCWAPLGKYQSGEFGLRAKVCHRWESSGVLLSTRPR